MVCPVNPAGQFALFAGIFPEWIVHLQQNEDILSLKLGEAAPDGIQNG